MMRFRPPRHPSLSPAGAIASILALAWIAPPAAVGGCANLVTSRSDPEHLASLVGTLMIDLAVQAGPDSAPPMPRPCAGAWCSGQPAAPPATAGTGGAGGDPWAWSPSIARRTPIAAHSLAAEAHRLRPLHRGPAVFHPPRPVPSA